MLEAVDAQLPARGAVRRRRARSVAELRALRADRRPAHGRQSARQWRPAAARSRSCPISATTPSRCRQPGERHGRGDARAGRISARRDAAQRTDSAISASSARTRPPPTGSTRVFEVTDRVWMPSILPYDDASRARRPRDGGAERASLPGLARRLSADRPARLLLLLRGLHPHRRFDVQPARQMAEGHARHCRGGGRSPR